MQVAVATAMLKFFRKKKEKDLTIDPPPSDTMQRANSLSGMCTMYILVAYGGQSSHYLHEPLLLVIERLADKNHV